MKKKYQVPVTMYVVMDTMQMIAESMAVYDDETESLTNAFSRENDFWDESE